MIAVSLASNHNPARFLALRSGPFPETWQTLSLQSEKPNANLLTKLANSDYFGGGRLRLTLERLTMRVINLEEDDLQPAFP